MHEVSITLHIPVIDDIYTDVAWQRHPLYVVNNDIRYTHAKYKNNNNNTKSEILEAVLYTLPYIWHSGGMHIEVVHALITMVSQI